MNTKRTLGWLGFFTVAAALTWIPEHFFTEPAPATDAASVAGSQEATPAQAAKAQANKDKPAIAGDLFAAKSWKPVVAMATVTEQPLAAAPDEPAPTAPPLPFQFIGRLDNQQDQQIFLQNGEKLYVVRHGDVIDNTYRIDHISATELSLVYLPLHLTQTLSVGSAP
ncbi:hypothetical protein [Pseudomonas sp. R5(2019)]|uniref:hypothetical protein n=1 Tax=Pseudomonas sp. R5(2019) TaxID=2697566 RepID=UPI0014128E19|nr:hypothetical protein [Pseudomonas sp. R5(2019)]NBA96732.1 hypothetical protein [Pseudomonas sp. R5(2019)]